MKILFNWVAASAFGLLAMTGRAGLPQRLRLLAMTVLLVSLTSCGFKPVYKSENNDTHKLLAAIEIVPVSTIEGADYYNHLKNILPHSDKAKYLLDSNLKYTKSYSLIQKNSDPLRELVTIKVTYTLKDRATGKIITSGKFSRISSFNTAFSPYSNLVRQQDTHKNLSIISAEEVRNRIMLFSENNK